MRKWKAVRSRVPVLVGALANARRSLDFAADLPFVHDRFGNGQ
ncbi:hypothetical protein RGQ15_04755 [Paracoccus sp. MBLB3053]|uniref:Uncharacterized protein n=1 Tax=Paracoccus aurantius TaxID=3073814 RepID=A0ABU2HPB8_9RHOB|nr:hypothetical protein [Paracoccus sp. MBLB3053]MDS9466886.1 hypothetical protein [Paracoccus sp. MBLB3053]